MQDVGHWPWVVALVVCVLYGFARLLLRVRRKCFEVFKDTGIPGPPVKSLINGNSDEYWNPTTFERIGQWLKEYGDVFGFYLGAAPIVVIKDLDILKQIFTKDFSNFNARAHIMFIYELQPFLSNNVAFGRGRAWKEARSCVGQFFTPAKLKMVMPSLVDGQRQFIEVLGKCADTGAEVNITKYLERLTFDVISKMAFGIETDVQRKPENPIFQTALTVLPNIAKGFVYNTGQNLFPWPWLLRRPLQLLSLCFANPLAAMTDKAKAVIEFRRQNPEVNRPDLAQILIDYVLGRGDEAGENSAKIDPKVPIPNATMDMLASNSMAIFLGGYDTTRLAMACWFYLMGKYPDVQEKMREEALKAFDAEGEFLSMETLTNLTYTNQVICETLRLYPPIVTLTGRAADEDRRYGKYLIKKGTSVMVPVYQLHRDPLYWEDPEKFDPDRFSPENKHLINPYVYQPFGLGPRNCVGQRLGLLEFASVAAQVLRHFRITLGPSQARDLKLHTYSVLAAPKDGVWLQLHKLPNSVK
ncbi:cytochrome P450 3A4-like [Haemaphysalis longicornis]